MNLSLPSYQGCFSAVFECGYNSEAHRIVRKYLNGSQEYCKSTASHCRAYGWGMSPGTPISPKGKCRVLGGVSDFTSGRTQS